MARNEGSEKRRGPLTHFLCLPLITSSSKPVLERSLKDFTAEVVGSSSAAIEDRSDHPTVNIKAVRPVGTLHCTLAVMSLDSDGLDDAIKLLKSLDLASMLQLPSQDSPETTDNPGSTVSSGPLSVGLKGLESMHSPQSTSVLYTAPSDASGRLFPFCLRLQEAFTNSGLSVPDDRPLKLHATIVNTIYAKDKKQSKKDRLREVNERARGGHSSGRLRETGSRDSKRTGSIKIDARSILDRYQDFVWADSFVLDRVAICEMGAKKITNASGEVVDEEYTEVASIPLPLL